MYLHLHFAFVFVFNLRLAFTRLVVATIFRIFRIFPQFFKTVQKQTFKTQNHKHNVWSSTDLTSGFDEIEQQSKRDALSYFKHILSYPYACLHQPNPTNGASKS